MISQQLLDYESKVDEFISTYGDTVEYADAYFQAAQNADTMGCTEDALRMTKKAKECLDRIIFGKVKNDFFALERYCRDNGITTTEIDLYYSILRFEAPYLFDSYLLYLEKNRDYDKKFYQPKRKQLIKHGIIQGLQDLEDDKLDFLSISMPPGTQKCQPLYSKVLTPSGFTEMRSIDVGSQVITPDGNIATVISCSQTKKRKIYELTLDDGSKVRASDNHIWTVQTRDDRRKSRKHGGKKRRNVTTEEMLCNYLVENKTRANYSIDYVGKIDFAEKNFIIHPYVMGVILGDGGISQNNTVISTNDQELIDRELDRYGLLGHTSIDKFIPKDYLYCSYEQRLWLLRGLMDTDGSASNHYCSYATISEKLANDVAELVHSLGGYVSINRRSAGYKKDGEYKSCNDYFELIIEFSSEMDSIFALSRKNNKYKPKRKEIKRYITDISYVGEEDCKCIMIDDPCHLYITDNYIITHNTTSEKFFASWVIGKHPDDYSLFFSHSDDITRMFYDGVLSICTDDEYTWRDIFPNVPLRKTDASRQQFDMGRNKAFWSLQTTSIGSKNAGKVRCNRYLYCDDLIGGIEEALNINILDKIWRIYGTDAKQRKLNEQVKELMIATRWSVHDPIGRLKDIYGDSERARFIAIPDIDPETGKSNFDYEYNGMTEKFFHDQELTMDDISYRCLYKNEPIEREGLLYHEDELRRFLDLPLHEPDAILGICDTKSKGTDYLFMPVAYQYGNDYYIVDCICTDSSDYGVQYERMSNLLVSRNVQQCEFESNAGGDRVALEVQKLVDAKGGRCHITTKPTETNKETRIIVNADWVKKHCLFRSKEGYTPKDDYGIMLKWLLSYTVAGKNAHDDVPDGFANFALYCTRGNVVSRVEVIKNPFRSGYYGGS